MRHKILFLLLFAATPLFAAGTTGRARASVLRVDNGFGFNLAYALSPAWEAELGIAEQRFDALYTEFRVGPGGISLLPLTTLKRFAIRPVDLAVTRHFASDWRVSPYLRAGARYVDVPADPPNPQGELPPIAGVLPASPGFHLQDRSSAQAGGGVLIRLTPRTALRAEAMRLLRSDGTRFDPLTRYAVGVSWLPAAPASAAGPTGLKASVLRVQHGFGVTLAYVPNGAWGIEAGLAEQSFQAAFTGIGISGGGAVPLTFSQSFTVHPVDLLVTRQFARGARVSPYVRAGARYVGAPETQSPVALAPGQTPVTLGFHLQDRTSAQAGGGVLIRLTPRTALRAEATRLLRSNDAAFDPLTRVAAGLSWDF